MYSDGIIHDVVIRDLKKFRDDRGWLIELFRTDELDAEYFPVMSYVSQTLPGIARGPHEHVEQADLFCFIGPSRFKVYLWDARKESPTYLKRMTFVAGENEPKQVLIPKGVVHAYKNIGDINGLVYNFPNRLYAGKGKTEPVDEIRHEDRPDSPFRLE